VAVTDMGEGTTCWYR